MATTGLVADEILGAHAVTDEPGSPHPTNDEPQGELLPAWSTLAILLGIFAMVAVLTLGAVLKGDPSGHDDDRGGTVAYGPADFPEIAWDEPLLPAVVQATGEGRDETFNVPPAPFSSEEIFPCSACHADLEVDRERRELMFHEEIQLRHGPEERWCLDCHNAEDRDVLSLATGERIGFDESYRMCGQCHGTIYRDWRQGIHGRRRGFWNGAKSYLLCAHCHDPHAPKFAAIKPLAAPIRPKYLRKEETGHE